MTKRTVTTLFVRSLVAFAVGLLVLVGAGLMTLATQGFVMDGPDVVGVESTPVTWTAALLAAVGVLAMVAAGVAQVVAWVFAVLATARLEDKMWFVVLLVLGVLSLGFVGTLVYVAAGPDPDRVPPSGRTAPAPPATSGFPVATAPPSVRHDGRAPVG
ncbi:hypothetical protein [Actinotalea solisilvae]|uniref:hypothetical protein n=1 Tax=Actinotalea solisilvae TaxID=2072922 RepID=UPI0018F16A7A|nr:hypothetical protein [Actinotalea solisilvae]